MKFKIKYIFCGGPSPIENCEEVTLSFYSGKLILQHNHIDYIFFGSVKSIFEDKIIFEGYYKDRQVNILFTQVKE